eukprot:TRINITY_DN3595_c0_g2_i3.p1 TRINITY_DN3595_c0_g2~~TRINITY_DN3595_c0_g2_i3.p1  ORF type:complete len:190 (-),score=30.26 TRINITY_DN3595_c0_g2_i3:72-641(-)
MALVKGNKLRTWTTTDAEGDKSALALGPKPRVTDVDFKMDTILLEFADATPLHVSCASVGSVNVGDTVFTIAYNCLPEEEDVTAMYEDLTPEAQAVLPFLPSVGDHEEVLIPNCKVISFGSVSEVCANGTAFATFSVWHGASGAPVFKLLPDSAVLIGRIDGGDKHAFHNQFTLLREDFIRQCKIEKVV